MKFIGGKKVPFGAIVRIAFIVMTLAFSACSAVQVRQPATLKPPPANTVIGKGQERSLPATGPAAGITVPGANFRPTDWGRLPAWRDDDLVQAWPAWLQSCRALGDRPGWSRVCALSARVDGNNGCAIRDFFQQNFIPHEVVNPDSTREGLVTGYYEPVLKGDRTRTDQARYPIYGSPPDLITVDLSNLYPELKFMRLRGRLAGNRLVPYYTREEIESGKAGFQGVPIAWANDPVDLFYLQIQGSGRVEFPDGGHIRIGYADQNGHPFRSVARVLIDRGELGVNGASMQAVRKWGRENPEKVAELLNRNPSYVFFRELPDGLTGPLGSLGVPLTGGRSIAVDPRYIPLGVPIFLATTWPLSERSLNRLMVAQDTGGAIRGAVRADFFWGSGDEAAAYAGRMKQKGKAWVLFPSDYVRLEGGVEKVSRGGVAQ